MLLLLIIVELFANIFSHPICDIAASTNIESLFQDWNCNSLGIPLGDYCVWSSVMCVEDEVTSISLQNTEISGRILFRIGFYMF